MQGDLLRNICTRPPIQTPFGASLGGTAEGHRGEVNDKRKIKRTGENKGYHTQCGVRRAATQSLRTLHVAIVFATSVGDANDRVSSVNGSKVSSSLSGWGRGIGPQEAVTGSRS